MFFGLFKKKVKVVKVKRKAKTKSEVKSKIRRLKPKKHQSKKIIARPKKKRTKAVKIKKVPRAKLLMPQIVGKVTHYFSHVKAAVLLVTDGTIAPGDTLQIKGHTTDFKQKVTSMQINNVAIEKAKPGQEIGLLVKSRVRSNDVVYKLK